MRPCTSVWHSRGRACLRLRAVELPGWKTKLSWVAAVLLAVLFLASGLWKITDTQAWAQRITQLMLPGALGVPLALVVGIAETFGAVLILVPRFRRWGAILIGLLLIAFIGYFALHYSALRGADCSCFPWIKRAVGPQFFLGDLAMLALAVLAGFYAAAEGLLLAVDVAGNVRRLAWEGRPAAASEPATMNPAAPREFCKVCGVGLVAGNTFCGNCGTRI